MEEKIKSVNLPEVVKQHVFGLSLAGFYEEIYADLDSQQIRPLNKLIWQIYRKEISLPDFLSQAQALNLPGFKEKIFPGILRYDFFIIADYLGIQISDWLKYLSEKEKADFKVISLAEWVAQYNVEKNFGLNDLELKRLEIVLKSFLQGVKEKEEIAEFLSRPEKVGGIEISMEAGDKILEDFKKRIEKAWQEDEIIAAQEVVEKELLNSLNVKFVKKEARESLAPFIPSIQLLDQTAEELIKNSGLIVPVELHQRFKIIIISRLKDVRKLPEMRERLLANPAAGGVGLKTEEAEKVVKMVEEERALNSLNIKFVKKEEKEESLQALKTLKTLKEEPLIIQQPERPVPVIPAEAGIQTPPLKPAPKPPPYPAPPPSLSVPLKPAAPPSVAITPRPKPAAVFPKISNIPASPAGRQYPISSFKTSSDIQSTSAPSAVKIIPQEKKPPKVELTLPPPLPSKPVPTTAIPQTPTGRAKVEDVAYKPRLVGPLEELKEMSLLDFRRLAPQPKVTTDKIFAKIELLAGEGYAKKIKGIEAWQKSPVNRLYLEILNAMLAQSKPIEQVIEERRSAGKETLSSEEFRAVTELNRRLRY